MLTRCELPFWPELSNVQSDQLLFDIAQLDFAELSQISHASEKYPEVETWNSTMERIPASVDTAGYFFSSGTLLRKYERIG